MITLNISFGLAVKLKILGEKNEKTTTSNVHGNWNWKLFQVGYHNYAHPYQKQNQKKVFFFYQALLTTGAAPVTALPPVFNHLLSSRVATSASVTE